MPSTNSGFPYSTKWKNYRYPLTRLEAGVGYTGDTASGHFATNGLDVWIEHDYALEADVLGSYRVIMTGGLPDECNTIYRPNYFVDGTSGMCDASAATGLNSEPWFKLGNEDSIHKLDVQNSTRATQSSEGNNQSLYMIAPGLYIGFIGTSATAYSTNDEFAFTLKGSALAGIPKVMDNTYTAYCKMPLTDGDIIYTHNLPTFLSNQSLNFMLHFAPDFPKIQETSTTENCAISAQLEESIDNNNYVGTKSVLDISAGWDWKNDGIHLNVVYDKNALNESMPHKRLKITHTEGGVSSTSDMQGHNWIKMAITPF